MMRRKRPVVGIVARRFRTRAFGEQTSYLRGIIKLATARGMKGYVFGVGDVDWTRARIYGWHPAGKGWVRRWFPFPDVVYDRAWGLDAAARAAHVEALQRLNRLGIPHFNPDFGDKIDVYNLLLTSERVARHLPETLPLTARNVGLLGERFSTLYIKPTRGRQGKGIRRCRRLSDGWSLQSTGARGAVTRRLPSEEAVVGACLRGADGEPYLVQQGLDLVTLSRGTVDIRVIAQRNLFGEWRVSAIGVRAGKPGGLVSNLHAGGRALTLTKLVRGARLREPVARLNARIHNLALEAAEVLSRAYPTLGELGIDIGLDTRGRIWILEINRQPGRALFSRARLRRAWRRSRFRVVQFAKFLATHKELGEPTSNELLGIER